MCRTPDTPPLLVIVNFSCAAVSDTAIQRRTYILSGLTCSALFSAGAAILAWPTLSALERAGGGKGHGLALRALYLIEQRRMPRRTLAAYELIIDVRTGLALVYTATLCLGHVCGAFRAGGVPVFRIFSFSTGHAFFLVVGVLLHSRTCQADGARAIRELTSLAFDAHSAGLILPVISETVLYTRIGSILVSLDIVIAGRTRCITSIRILTFRAFITIVPTSVWYVHWPAATTRASVLGHLTGLAVLTLSSPANFYFFLAVFTRGVATYMQTILHNGILTSRAHFALGQPWNIGVLRFIITLVACSLCNVLRRATATLRAHFRGRIGAETVFARGNADTLIAFNIRCLAPTGIALGGALHGGFTSTAGNARISTIPISVGTRRAPGAF